MSRVLWPCNRNREPGTDDCDMDVLVTGGSGLIGRAAVRELQARGHAVRVLQRGPPEESLRGVENLVADVTWPAARRAVEAAEAVLHLAGRGDVSESWQAPGSYLDLIVGGTLNILEGARRSGATVVI